MCTIYHISSFSAHSRTSRAAADEAAAAADEAAAEPVVVSLHLQPAVDPKQQIS